MKGLKGTFGGVNWVRSENFHLTLKFMGEIEKSAVPSLEKALAEASVRQSEFPLEIRGSGAFPGWERPKVFWAGAEDPSGKMSHLAAEVEKSTVLAGFPPSDRPFSAHLTLARFSVPPSPGCAQKLQSERLPPSGRFQIDRMFLVQSTTGPSGPRYTDLREFPLHAG